MAIQTKTAIENQTIQSYLLLDPHFGDLKYITRYVKYSLIVSDYNFL